MTRKLSIDFETRSRCDLERCGSYKYFEHPSTENLVLAVKEGSLKDGPPVLSWDARKPVKDDPAIELLRQAIVDRWEIHAFNSQFEWGDLKYVCPRQFGLPVPDINRLRCTQALARSTGLQNSLGQVAEFLKLPVQKDKMGKALIQKFSIPQKKTGEFINWDDDVSFTAGGQRMTAAEAFQKFVDYCETDVRTELAVAEALKVFTLEGYALDSFLLTARLNDRGVPVDVVALKRACEIFREHELVLTRRFRELTGLSPAQNAKALAWFRDNGYGGGSLDKATREIHGSGPNLSDEAKEALDIKARLSFAAVKKVPTMLDWVMDDGFIRGSFKWCGAQKTWRWSSEGVQWQNCKKPAKKFRPFVERAFQDIKAGADRETIALLYGDPYEVVASLARYFARFPDKDVYDTDYSSVEAKILPMLIDCRRVLDRFDSGEDIYTTTGRSLSKVLKEKFGVPFEIDRDTGKTVVLACIAEGELVLTDRGLVPIEKVSHCHTVWDGVEWVHHEGVICRGEKDIIEYQGLRATPDHEVFCRQGEGQIRKVPLWRAVSDEADLVTAERSGSALRVSDDRVEGGSPMRCVEGGSEGASPVRLREDEVGELPVSPEGGEPVLPSMRHEEGELRSAVAPETCSGAETKVRQSGVPALPLLRGARDRVPVPISEGRMSVDCSESRSRQNEDIGPDRQQRSLRGGELAVVVDSRTAAKQEGHRGHPGDDVPRVALRDRCGPEVLEAGVEQAGDLGRGRGACQEQAKGVAPDQGTARVYDIVNAGPRHRFTVSGKLVSNCQFQGGWNAVFTATGGKWKREWCEVAAAIVRKENPEFVTAWRRFQDTFVLAMDQPGVWHAASPYVSFGFNPTKPFPRMMMRLPSGRSIVMPYPEKSPITMVRVETLNAAGEVVSKRWEQVTGHHDDADDLRDRLNLDWPSHNPLVRIKSSFKTWEISFWGHTKNTHYGRVKTYGGDLLQSATQATGVDLLALGTLKAERVGYDPFFLVHDQALTPAEGSMGRLTEALCTVPEWFKGFPLSAETKRERSYCKS